MNTSIQGISTNTTPFITSILAPQLRSRNMPLFFVTAISEVPTVQASYTLLDGDTVLQQTMAIKQQLRSYISGQPVSVALTMGKSHQQKLALLELGFSHCLELPIATEVIIKTIENSIRSRTASVPTLRERTGTYNSISQLAYLHDKQGRHFLTNHTRSVYLSANEQRILEYLLDRDGFASKNELSYAGWHHFDIRANTVTVTIKKLRKKLKELSMPYSIRTLYGYGYSLQKGYQSSEIPLQDTTAFDVLASP